MTLWLVEGLLIVLTVVSNTLHRIAHGRMWKTPIFDGVFLVEINREWIVEGWLL